MMITRKAIPRRTMLRGIGATLALPLLDAMVPALTALQKTAGEAGHPVRRDVRAERHGHGAMDAGRRRRRLRADADAGAARAVPRRAARVEQPGLRAHARAARRRPRQGQHAVPHRRVAADERDLARRRHLDGSDRSRARSAAHAAGVARAGDRIGRDGRRVRRRLRVRLHQHDLVAQRRTRRCRRRTTRARCSSGCSATAAAPTRRRGWRASARTAACSTRSARRSRTCRARSGRAIASSSSSTSTPSATSSGASRRPRSRATWSCRVVDHPAGIPATYDEHVKLMCDLQVLAYQTDLTRVVTFMLGREFSGVTYPQIGVPDAHHPITHHQQEAGEDRQGREDQRLSRRRSSPTCSRSCARRPTATARCSIT